MMKIKPIIKHNVIGVKSFCVGVIFRKNADNRIAATVEKMRFCNKYSFFGYEKDGMVITY